MELEADPLFVKVMLRVGVPGVVPVQVKLAYLVLPKVELVALTQVPAVVVRLQVVIVEPPSASSAEVMAVNTWAVVELEKLMVTLTGLVLTIVVALELLLVVEVVQVVAVAFSWHLMFAPIYPAGITQVLEVAPPIAVVPLYHCQVLAPVFSESESMSVNVPALQVRVCPIAGVPVIVMPERVTLWSGYAFVPVVELVAAEESVNVTLIVGVPGVVPVHVKLAYLLLPLAKLEVLTQEPAVVVAFQPVMVEPPSASSA